MNGLNIHGVKNIVISEIEQLDSGTYRVHLIVHQNSSFHNAENDVSFDITLFSDKPENLETFNISN